MRTLLLAASIAIVAQQPTFRSRVDLIRLDVTVVDAQGQPVRDLRPEDFTVSIDGHPRRVAFAQFYGADDTPRAAAPDAPLTVASNIRQPPGRIVILVADIDSLTLGYEKPLFETAAALVDRLRPSDAVGVLVLQGLSVELTRDHGKVRDALRALRGTASPPAFSRTLSVREAEGFRHQDRRIIAEVTERECPPQSSQTCPIELHNQVMPTLLEADRRMQLVVNSISALFERLERIEAPKTVVLLSAGLQRREGTSSYFRELERRAKSAQVSMLVVQVEQPEIDARRRDRGGVVPRADLLDGLSALAGATDAVMYFGVGRAAGTFERIRNGIVNFYQLGVEAEPADSDGRVRRVQVHVGRNGVSVRARKEVILARPADSAASNPVDLLSQPVDYVETPLRVATYTTRGEEASALKLIVLLELDAASAEPRSGSYAFNLTADGRTVFETADHVASDATSAVTAAHVPPGRYRLRAAAVDPAGRRASLDMPILIGLREAGALQLSDLIIGTGGSAFTPVTRAAANVPLLCILELYAADPARLAEATVTIEAERAGASSSVRQFAADVRATALERRRIATSELHGLAPGTWLIAAIVHDRGVVLGRVSRQVVVDPAPLLQLETRSR